MKTALLLTGVLIFGSAALAEDHRDVDPRAEQVLKSACRFLADTPHFTLSAEMWRDHLEDSGQKVQYVRQADMQVQRPNRLHADIHSPHSHRGFWFDGKSLTILDAQRNFFSNADLAGTLDKAVDTAREQFGVDLPLIDLAVSDPYENAIAKVQKGTYLGLSSALGYSCHHLAFTQPNIDWQVWIQDGPQPLIRKFVINHKTEPGGPEFTALITNWDITGRISDAAFVFIAPPGATKVEMLKQTAGGAKQSPGPQEHARLTTPKDR